jgi:alpha-glucosidase
MILGVQGGIDRAVEKAEKMLDAGAKVSAVWCQDWCGKKVTAAGKQVLWNWEEDTIRYKDLANRIKELNKKGVRFLAYINPYLVKDGKLYNYCKGNDYLVKNKDGEICNVVSTTFEFGMMDLTNKAMVEFLKETIIKKNMLDLGIDGYMADFGEYLPVDCLLADGNALLLHNYWPTLWAKINREAIDSHSRSKEIFFFTRSGYNAAQTYTPIMWNGDQHTCYYKDYGMPCVMPATFNLGFSGMPILHSDTGGFISFAQLKRDAELFVRWMEMTTFSPLMRSHESIRPEKNAQYDDENVIEHTIRLTNLHYKLKPYLLELMEQAKEGIPVMRPDFYNSGDYTRHKDLYSYFLGDEIFVSPIIEKGCKQKKIFLPKGTWVRFFDDKTYNGYAEYVFDTPLGMPLAFYLKDDKHTSIFNNIKLI